MHVYMGYNGLVRYAILAAMCTMNHDASALPYLAYTTITRLKEKDKDILRGQEIKVKLSGARK